MNKKISASLSDGILIDRILQPKGIDATLEVANSQNAKVVFIDNGDDGMPLILGNN